MIRRQGSLLVTLVAWLAVACSPDAATPTPVASGIDASPVPTVAETEAAPVPTSAPPSEPASPGPSPAVSAAPSQLAPSPSPLAAADAWGRLTARIPRDGSVPLDVALEAFALTVGPLPGVETPEGDAPPISSASGPTRWLIGHWDELTPEQQAAAQALLVPAAAPAAFQPGLLASSVLATSLGGALLTAAGAAPSCAVEATGPKIDQLRATLDQALPFITEKLGRPLSFPVIFTLGELPETGDPVKDAKRLNIAGNTTPLDGDCRVALARPAVCQIQVTSRGQNLPEAGFRHLVAHELFHCFQFDFATSAKATGAVPAWLAEGDAAWVGEQFSLGSTIGEEYWLDWLKVPHQSLFTRDYDGIGFFSHLADSGIDPWPILVSMHRKGESSSADAYGVAVKGPAAQRMIDAWGPSYIRHQTLVPDWSTEGLGLPPYVSTPVGVGVLGATDSYILDSAPEAGAAAKLDAQSDVIVFEGRDSRGLVHFADGTQWALKDVLGKPICLKGEACSCPAGSPGAAHAWMTASKGEVLVGISGHTDGAHIIIDGFDVNETCQHPPADFQPEEPCWCPPGALGLVEPGTRGTASRVW